MQYTTLALGAVVLLFAIYTTVMRFKSPQELIKLKYMRDEMGMKAGTIVHTVAYVLVPVIFSVFILKAGMNGVTIVEFITGRASIS